MAFDLYFAGRGYDETLEYMISLGCCKLLTYDGEQKVILDWASKKASGQIKNKMFVDSGAYTAFTKGRVIDIDKYISFINDLGINVDYFCSLDVIPGKMGVPLTREQVDEAAEKSWQNFLYMRTKLTYPTRCLPVFHQGEDFKWLQRMLAYKDSIGPIQYICAGGGADKPAKERDIWYAKVFDVIARSGNPNVKVHTLGTSSPKALEKFPFYSADATSWIRSAAFGRIFTDFGHIIVSGHQDNDPDHISMDTIGLPILRQYVADRGFDLDDMIYDNPEKQTKANVERMKFNIKYLHTWAESYEYRGPKVLKKNKLF